MHPYLVHHAPLTLEQYWPLWPRQTPSGNEITSLVLSECSAEQLAHLLIGRGPNGAALVASLHAARGHSSIQSTLPFLDAHGCECREWTFRLPNGYNHEELMRLMPSSLASTNAAFELQLATRTHAPHCNNLRVLIRYAIRPLSATSCHLLLDYRTVYLGPKGPPNGVVKNIIERGVRSGMLKNGEHIREQLGRVVRFVDKMSAATALTASASFGRKRSRRRGGGEGVGRMPPTSPMSMAAISPRSVTTLTKRRENNGSSNKRTMTRTTLVAATPPPPPLPIPSSPSPSSSLSILVHRAQRVWASRPRRDVLALSLSLLLLLLSCILASWLVEQAKRARSLRGVAWMSRASALSTEALLLGWAVGRALEVLGLLGVGAWEAWDKVKGSDTKSTKGTTSALASLTPSSSSSSLSKAAPAALAPNASVVKAVTQWLHHHRTAPPHFFQQQHKPQQQEESSSGSDLSDLVLQKSTMTQQASSRLRRLVAPCPSPPPQPPPVVVMMSSPRLGHTKPPPFRLSVHMLGMELLLL